MRPLTILTESRVVSLRESIAANLDAYTQGDFNDLARIENATIELQGVQVDDDALATMNGRARTADGDIENSIIVYHAFHGMTPALATDERVWVYLSHFECLPYSRTRWLTGLQDERLVKSIATHMFARGRTGVRDDNAVSRLWWNMHIASVGDPDDPVGALQLILKSADVRMQLVERTRTAARRPLLRAILRALRRNPSLTSTAGMFRRLMIAINRDGGGILFEALSDDDADRFIDGCVRKARKSGGNR